MPREDHQWDMQQAARKSNPGQYDRLLASRLFPFEGKYSRQTYRYVDVATVERDLAAALSRDSSLLGEAKVVYCASVLISQYRVTPAYRLLYRSASCRRASGVYRSFDQDPTSGEAVHHSNQSDGPQAMTGEA